MKILVFLFILCCSSAYAQQAGAEAALFHDGMKRHFIAYVPSLERNVKPPVVILLHGGTQSAKKVWQQTTLPLLAEKYGFILVAPDGVNNQWNDGREIIIGGERSTADDVGFIEKLIKKIVRQYNADPEKIFITGASNGGMMTYRMLCERSDIFAAAAAVIASLPEKMIQDCALTQIVPIMLMLGTADPILPWEGGFSEKTGVAMTSGMQTFSYFQKRANCRDVQNINIPDINKNDGSTLTLLRAQNCDSAVTMLRVNGGGHHWVNTQGRREFPLILGRSNRDADGGTIIWNFFRAQ